MYLSLFLAAKFSAVIPFLAPSSYETQNARAYPDRTNTSDRIVRSDPSSAPHGAPISPPRPRSQSAAPPLYLLVIVLIPIGPAVYIASTRYSDYKHAGLDVLFSSIEGAVCAWFAFRWYHLPIRRGAGWSWGPRSSDRAFGIGVDTGSYVRPKASKETRDRSRATDVERDGPIGHSADHIELDPMRRQLE